MDRARINEGVRRMRFEDLLGRHERGELRQEAAAEMPGISDRTVGRWRDRVADPRTSPHEEVRGWLLKLADGDFGAAPPEPR